MKIALVRGAFLNQYEAQMFAPLAKKHSLTAFSSRHPIHDRMLFPLVKLPSPMDINFGPLARWKMPVLNRLFVDAHWLIGLEEKLAGFDIAHCNETYYHFTHQCLLAKKQGKVKRVVATCAENIPFNNEGIWGRRCYKQFARENVDLFLALNERAKETLTLEGVDEKKITILPFFIDTKRFKPTVGRRGGPLTILFAGRLEFFKGVYEIAYAFKWLSQKYNLNLLFVGSGNEKKQLEKLVKARFVTASYDQMPEIYRQADIFVAPSRAGHHWQEQFGMTLLEAMASGLPIVTSFSGAIPETVGTAALFANPGDFYSLAQALEKFIQDPRLRHHYGTLARQRALKFDTAIGTEKLAVIYEQVLQNNRV
ncbi:MAG: glycosyltransferase family 4 protein [Patescibacteria group bacterium]|nr:glycosyltransferase family 4 protein [Patescibacteria group bacterium]MCL5431753.1 glycosyltransferase family 4 protein [Patescibacteria group bacterium]